MKKIKKVNYCRLCKSRKLVKVLDFGRTPPANSFLTRSQLRKKEDFFPLVVSFCSNCGFLTLGHIVDPKILYSNYVYVSSTSPIFIKHFEDLANSVYSRFKLGKESLVIDIGSNDGILLKPFKKLGAKILGIEPATNISKLARKNGIPTVSAFFKEKVAKRIVVQKGKAKIVTATNLFTHIDDLDEVVRGVKKLLTDDGVFIIEVYYLVDLLEKRYFDLIYHEHLSYLSILPLDKFFKTHGMKIFDVTRIPVHGGSIRIFVKPITGPYHTHKSVTVFINLEKEKKLFDVATYKRFADNVKANKLELIKLLKKLKRQNKSIAGYGAPAKSTTLLHYFGIGKEVLDFIADDSPYKQGLFTPGTHIPVVSPVQIYKKKPDYLFLLAWNFADSIVKMQRAFAADGGRFIIPVPKPRLF